MVAAWGAALIGMLGSFTSCTSFPSEGGRGDWGSTSYRTSCRTAGSCEGKDWTLHEHEIDGKLHKYNMFTGVNLDNYPRELCVLHTDGVQALCTHTVSSCAQSVENCHILSEVHTNKHTNLIPHCHGNREKITYTCSKKGLAG